jgi:uncharacterized protein
MKQDIREFAVKLFEAVKMGDGDTVYQIIPKKLHVDICTDNGMTSLHMASWQGHLDIVQYLVEQGADVNKADKRAWTPLHCAAMNKRDPDDYRSYLVKKQQVDLVEYLLQKGAEPNKVNEDNQTPLDMAMISACLDVGEKLKEFGAKGKMFKGGWMSMEQFLSSNKEEVQDYGINAE